MIFLKLFWTFFKIGLFGFGGGYGMLSLIQMETVHNHHWLTSAELTNIVAISQMTPGPIGLNCARYWGFTAIHNIDKGNALSVLGSLVATFSLVSPSFVLMILIGKMFMRYMKARVVQSVFDGLRPAVVGLLAAATIMLLNKENFGSPVDTTWQFIISVLLFAATFYGTLFVKINPIKMIGYAAIAGLLLLY